MCVFWYFWPKICKPLHAFFTWYVWPQLAQQLENVARFPPPQKKYRKHYTLCLAWVFWAPNLKKQNIARFVFVGVVPPPQKFEDHCTVLVFWAPKFENIAKSWCFLVFWALKFATLAHVCLLVPTKWPTCRLVHLLRARCRPPRVWPGPSLPRELASWSTVQSHHFSAV